MKIGISTASLYPMETEKAFELLGRNGIPVTEIFFNSPSELREDFTDKLLKTKEKYGIEVASVHPCGSVGEPYFLFSEYLRRYEETRAFYRKYYAAAKKLGAKTVVLHGDSLVGHISMKEYCKRLCDMNLDAAEYGVSLSHENVNRYRAALPKNVEAIRRLGDDKQSFTFDVKQAVRAGCGVEEMLKAMKGKLVNVHISDNSSDGDCLLPGRGSFDFKGFFQALSSEGYDGACLIEVYRYAYDDVGELINSYRIVNNCHKNIDKL